MKPGWQESVLILTLVIASGFTDFRIRQYPDYAYTTYIPGVVDGSYGAPATYRVLVPFTNTWAASLTGASHATIWHVTRLAWFLVAYVGMFFYLQRWVSRQTALGGVAAVAATLSLTYTNSWAHADSIPELALFTLGCAAIAARSVGTLSVLLLIAALNRETSLFLVVAYFLSQPPSRQHLTRTALLAALCGSVLVGLRLWRGVEHYDYWQLTRNVAFLGLLPPGYDLYKRAYAWFVVALALPAAAVVASRWSAVPPDARRFVWSAIPLVVTGLTLSSIIEPRVFLPLYPMLLPALLCVLVQPKRDNEETRIGI